MILRRRVDHEQEALFRRRELRDVVLGVRSADVLLHGAVSFFLRIGGSEAINRRRPHHARRAGLADEGGGEQLTPMQRLRQLEPSWLRKGQTTSLLESVMENEDVNDE